MKGCHRIIFFFFLLISICSGHGQAQDLEFPEILEQAVANSYDLQISGLDVEIGEQRLAEAGAMYWPALSLRFGNEYLEDLGKDGNGAVVVGDTFISGNESSFQHSLTLSAEYLLYDFGARSLKYRNVQRDVILAQHAADQRLIDLKVDVLSLYENGLQLQKRIEIWTAMLGMRKEVYQYMQRLVEAGSKGKLEQGHAAIDVAEALQTCESLRLDMAAVLEKLTYYTGRSYRLADVRFADFPENTGAAASADVLNLPEIKAYDVAIEQKKAEYEIAMRQRLPILSLYSSYNMYGNDQTSYAGSFENLAEKNAVIGVALKMNLFNGFSDQAKAERLLKELRKLQVEKAKKVAEDEQTVRTLARKNILSAQGLEDWHAFRVSLEAQDGMGERLAERQILDRISWLQQRDAQLEKQLTLELAGVERCRNALHLQMLTEVTL